MSTPPVSLTAAVLDHVAASPTRTALVDGSGAHIDYGQLGANTSLISRQLAAAGVRAGDRVVVHGARTVETVLALIGVLRCGAIYCVVEPDTPPKRWSRLLEELAPAAVVSTLDEEAAPIAQDLSVLRVPPLAGVSGSPNLDMEGVSSGPAYVMFTSGSTGHPKGVVVGHESVLNMIGSYEELAPAGQVLQGTLLARPAFDVSVWEIFSVLARGGTLHVPADEVLADGELLWYDIVRRQVTSAYVPPGLLDTFVQAAERHSGKPPALDRLLVGVEPILAGVLTRLLRAVPGLRVVNGYGPTEATVTATLYLCPAGGDPRHRTPIGRPVHSSVVTLVDDRWQPVAPGNPGEIVISGACLALGYLRPSDEVGKFVDGVLGRSYRTGDIARELPDGNLEYIGRVDDQLKVGGVRVEPGELEYALAGAPGVRRSVVLVSEQEGGRRLIAFVEGDPVPSTAAVRSHLGTELPPHLLPARVLAVRQFPLTKNGKVDSAALLAADGRRPTDGPAYEPPATNTERELATACARVLGIDLVGAHDDLFWLGASSLDVLRVCATLGERGLRCTPARVLRTRTVRALADSLDNDAHEEIRVAAPAMPGTYPTTRSQQGLWAWRELHPDLSDTTVMHVVHWEPAREVEMVRRALEVVAHRQEALRTTFEFDTDGRLLQRVHAPRPTQLACHKADDDAAVSVRIKHLQHRRLEVRESAWYAELIVTAETSTLVVVADHLVMDGESALILERELEDAYELLAGGGEPNAEPVPGPVSAVIRPAPAESDVSALYWREVLADVEDIAVLPEPVLAGRGPRRSAQLRQQLPVLLWEQLRALARSESTTPIVVVLALLEQVLSRRAGGPALVCLAVSRRTELGLNAAIGNAVNMVPIPVKVSAGTFVEHLRVVRELASTAVQHAGTPFEDMAAGSGNRPPVPRIVLAQHVTTPSQARIGRLPRPVSHSIHELTVFVEEPAAGREAIIEWVWDEAATLPGAVQSCAAAFGRALNEVARRPDIALIDLPYLGQGEEKVIFGASGVIIAPEPRSIPKLFSEQLLQCPGKTAVQWSGGTASYAELNARADQISSLLARDLGGSPAGVVAVVLEKGPDLIAAFLAVMRTGGAYLPLDPAHAPTRLRDVVASGHVTMCVTRAGILTSPPPGLRTVLVDEVASVGTATIFSPASPQADDLAYVMPTSGSTGTPHLVGVPHRAVSRLVRDNRAFPLDSSDRTVLVANTSFDAATFEIWGALCNGGSVLVAEAIDLEDIERLCRMIERERITAAFFTVTLFARVLESEPHRLRGLRHLIVGGEAVPTRMADRALEVVGPGVFINGYGPTENTTFSCTYRVHAPMSHLRSLPLGTPIGGSGVHILNSSLLPVPIGVPGEIVVTGDGLAVGYLDDEALTSDRFVPLPGPAAEPAYRTGDLGRLLPDGEVEYLGRIDRQLKIRGFRVEPREIEVVLEGHPDVLAAVVFAEDTPGEKRLLAAVQSIGTNGPFLRTWLRGVLPPYLVPDRIVVVEEFPMTANGKLDLDGLLTLSRTLSSGALPGEASGHVALSHAEGEVGRRVLATWQEALGVADLGVDDDVFEAGANSMTVLVVAARLASALGRTVPAHVVYASRSVSTLARRLVEEPRHRGAESGSPQEGAGNRRNRAEARVAKVRSLHRGG